MLQTMDEVDDANRGNDSSRMFNSGHPLHFKSRFLVVGRKNFIIIEVANRCNRTIEIWDVHMVHISDTKNVVSVECNPKIGLFCGKLITLKPIERYNISLELNVAASHSFQHAKKVRLHMVTEWRFADNTLQQNTVVHHLPKLCIRQPAFRLEASSYSPAYVGQKFLVNYTVANNLQDFIVELKWSPDKFKMTNEGKSSIVCHQPHNVLQCFKHGSKVTVGITFTVFQEGIVELSDSMKVSFHYQDKAETKGRRASHSLRYRLVSDMAHIPPIVCEDNSGDEEDHQADETDGTRRRSSSVRDAKTARLTTRRVLGQPCQMYIFRNHLSQIH